MVMYLPPRSSSAGMRSIRRELLRRRPKPLAATRSVAKKPSLPPPPPQPPPQGSSGAVRGPCSRPPHLEVPIPSSTNAHSRASTVADQQPRPRAASLRGTPASPPPPPPPPPRSAPSSAKLGATPGVPAHLKPGTVVRVRTRIATLKTGQVLVLCLKATIVSSSTNGGYEVLYDADFPRGDPKSTVYVAPDQVRVIDPFPSASPTTPPPSLPPPTATVAATTKKEMPRPTTAGKSLRLIRSLFPEMELPARA